ncbi:MAG: Rrf2 family transcriptional regulator [Campylobacterales bacterium]|nr:Rrf2 family transcriptional regulator [Campylobacterales bacterium]
MALVSSKGMYGLAAMYELYLLKSSKPVQIKDISLGAAIPQNYLEQLLGQLKKAGLLTSVRGAYGGYLLAKDARDITIKEIFVALEGNLNIVDSEMKNPVLALFYEEKKRELESIFDIALSDLETYEQKISKQISYTI